ALMWPTVGPEVTKQRRRLAAELRRLRREAHVSDDELRNAGIHPATWYRIVRGQTRKPQRRTVETLLDLFGVYGRRREELLAMASGDGAPDWLDAYDGAISDAYAEYIIVEANARCISNAET